MNRSALKKYAPQARLDFIEAVTLRARRLGLDPSMPVSVEQTGDVLLIGGQPFPASVSKQRSELARRIQQQGFNPVIEALAYTWFNRLVAIRFMELKGYLSHGYRVLSHPQGQQPEILDHVQHLDLPGLDKSEVIRLKTAGNQDEALYREILLAQCHELHSNMPFLFEALDDATELLLPDNLLRTDSPIAHLISEIEEADWQEVEVIGWLYQFYISDKKDEVMGKVVKSEDIPAATQLFTPNWIVQYLVQNSLGRLWLMANPGSTLREKGAMKYYVEPAEQTPEVQAQLDALIKVRMDEDGGTLNPESLTVLDPACGSGHILVEAYNLLRAIYEERGYRLREIPRLILQKNLYGLDIDDRAAQLAGFALLMKAREDDRRLFDDEGNPPHLNVMAIQQSAGLPDEEMARVILNAAIQIEGGDAFHSGQLFGGAQLETQHSSGLTMLDLRQLIQLFEHGKNFGSLIIVPELIKAKLGKIVDMLSSVRRQGDYLSRSYASEVLEKFAWPASLLVMKYDAVVANPPYMGSKGMNFYLKEFAKKSFPDSKSDLFSMFIERGFSWCNSTGFNSMVTMQSWMFLSSYQIMREKILANRVIHTLAHLGARAFSEISGEVVQAAAFVLQGKKVLNFKPVFIRLVDGGEDEKVSTLLAERQRYKNISQDDFNKIPSSPLGFWVGPKTISLFDGSKKLGEISTPSNGVQTGDNGRYVRFWYEVDSSLIDKKWYGYNKGGSFRRWYGNISHVVDWECSGARIKSEKNSCARGEEFYFSEGLTWSDITSGAVSCRYLPAGNIFDAAGPSAFFKSKNDLYLTLALINTSFSSELSRILNPTLHFQGGDYRKLPVYSTSSLDEMVSIVDEAIEISRIDWDDFEEARDFSIPRLMSFAIRGGLLSNAWADYCAWLGLNFDRLKFLEERNNIIFVQENGLEGEISTEVQDHQITLARPSQLKDMQRLVSFSIGCMMGRYSLDEPGLIYSYSSNIGRLQELSATRSLN